MSNLFICGTPLQSLIALKIIEINKFDKNECRLFFYSSVNNDKYKYYYNKLSEKCCESVYYLCDFRFPSYLVNAKKVLSELAFDTIYLASVNSAFSLLALSLDKHRALYTFDDGTANILPSSSYAKKFGLSVKKYFALLLLGNSYSINRIRKKSLGHYTIYPGFPNNISNNLIPITLFSGTEKAAEFERCSVILGTVFGEAFDSECACSVASKLSAFSKTLKGNVFFIPHPRGEEFSIENCQLLKSEKIAEDIILELKEQYRVIDLYGFCSSVQVNLSNDCSIRNTFLSVSGGSSMLVDMYSLADVVGMPPYAVVDLDEFC